ncbi:chorion class CB protein M5H4-like [Bombyx mori]|uniref:Chorion early B n=1 Tax=Bombyx mori TaxID=7091 RepID=A0A0K2S351_BOMMO|nr:chorion class CB protein M5H4-like [Bombyx mori]BAS21463.1 chorion early B [Bombyx mori]
MATNIVLLVCFQVLLVQTAFSQCLGRDPLLGGLGPYGPGWGPYDPIGPFDGSVYGAPYSSGFITPGSLAASCGGGLAVTSNSPITPTGLTVTSENSIEGTVSVVGQLPFLGAVATDGAFPTAGLGAVVYGCGDGAIGIVSEAPISAPGPVGYGGWPGVGYKGPCGCGGIY